MIDPRAVVAPGARLHEGVSVGPYTVIGDDVEIGRGTRIEAHAVIKGPTVIGEHNHIFQFASLGDDPQDKKYNGERTTLVIGDRNTIREFVTMNRGTVQDRACTRIGNDNWIMAYVHVAHDCVIGDHTVFANNASIAGHVHVGDFAILGGFTAVHQFCRIGAHAFLGMGVLVGGDVPPFVMVAENEQGRPRGINAEGLKRRGFDGDRIAAIKRAYRALYVSGDSLAEAKERIAELAADSSDVRDFLGFIESGERPLLR